MLPTANCQLELIHQVFDNFRAFRTVNPDPDLSIDDISPDTCIIAVHNNRKSRFACQWRIKRVSVSMAAQHNINSGFIENREQCFIKVEVAVPVAGAWWHMQEYDLV